MSLNESNLICPISLQIFRHPVVASDNQTYECEYIKQILETTRISPITKVELTDSLHYSYFAKIL